MHHRWGWSGSCWRCCGAGRCASLSEVLEELKPQPDLGSSLIRASPAALHPPCRRGNPSAVSELDALISVPAPLERDRPLPVADAPAKGQACSSQAHCTLTAPAASEALAQQPISAVPTERGWTVDVYEKRGMPEDKETSRNYALVLHVRGLRALQATGFDMSSFEHSFQGELKHSLPDLHIRGLQAAGQEQLEHSLQAEYYHSPTAAACPAIGRL